MTFSQFKKELYYISEGIMLNKARDTLETYGMVPYILHELLRDFNYSSVKPTKGF